MTGKVMGDEQQGLCFKDEEHLFSKCSQISLSCPSDGSVKKTRHQIGKNKCFKYGKINFGLPVDYKVDNKDSLPCGISVRGSVYGN